MSGRTFTLPEMSGKPFEQMCDTTPQCGVPSKLMENGASGILVPDVSCGFGSDPGHDSGLRDQDSGDVRCEM